MDNVARIIGGKTVLKPSEDRRTATDGSGGSIHCAARSWPDLAFPPMPQNGQMDARLCATGAAQEGDPSSFPIPQERGAPS